MTKVNSHKLVSATRKGQRIYKVTVMKGLTVKKAKVFRFGKGQAVRLPKQFYFHADEVEIFRRGNEIILREPRRKLEQAFAALAAMPKDFMSSGRHDQPPQKRYV